MPVLDTSIVVCYLLNEERAAAALALLIDPQAQAPDIIHLECSNALVTAVRRGRIGAAQVPERLRLVHRLGWATHDHRLLLDQATAISLEHDRRPYDGIFLALADRLGTELITTDAKLLRGMQGTRYARRIRLLKPATAP